MANVKIKRDPLSIKQEIFDLVREYYEDSFAAKKFIPGESPVPVSGKVFDHEELNHIVESALDGWFTTGRFNETFEKELAKFINTKRVITVNSGSSANLLAFAALTAEELGERAIKPGDELIAKLTESKIATRLLFAGDIRKQPYFKNKKYRLESDLKNTEIILNNTFWIGVTPMINDEMIDYVIKKVHEFLK